MLLKLNMLLQKKNKCNMKAELEKLINNILAKGEISERTMELLFSYMELAISTFYFINISTVNFKKVN